jgi:SNF2 family DNA or RNA helicase
MVVLDEASAIKGFKTQRSKKAKKLFKETPFRLALTATPIENRPEELFSIMQFVDPKVLGRYDLFEKAYINRNPRGWVSSYKNLDVLKQRLGDAMIRKSRTDPDVAPYLPEVQEDNWSISMDAGTVDLYYSIACDMLKEIAAAPFWDSDSSDFYNMDDNTPGRLMAMHMVMEMLLCHPKLIDWSADNYLNGKDEGSEYAHLVKSSGALKKFLSFSKPFIPLKLKRLDEELKIILDETDSKVLIYSKYKFMLDILQTYLPYKSVLFTGDMSAKEKETARKQFAEDSSIKLFLSSHAGGYGLDMNMADYLINYDLPWSFGTQDQINSRHVRASSKFKTVFVRNLIVSDTIEERKYRVLARKRKIADLAIDGRSPDSYSSGATVHLDQDMLKDHLISFTDNYRSTKSLDISLLDLNLE